MSVMTLGSAVPARPRDGNLIPPPGGLGGVSGPYVYDVHSARRIPAVARCLQIIGGMCKQMPIDVWRGVQPLPRPALLRRPDPNNGRPWFVQVSVEDYLMTGNAISYITARGADGWPASVAWLSAAAVSILWQPWTANSVSYYYYGEALDVDNVVHVKRGAHRRYPVRGVGVVEEMLGSLDRVAMEEEYERNALAGGAVPSVAVITPQATLTQDTADEAKAAWVAKLGGPVREPVILPNGTQVIPLAWSPTDTQLIEARKLSLTDVANMFNVDGYWLGAPVAGMTYRTSGPQYQQILRTTLEPILADFESEWSFNWLPRGQDIRFDRYQLLRDDLPTTAGALVQLVGAEIIAPEEARAILALPVPAGGTSEPLALQDSGGLP
jgi:HK97 family phage portal protein